MNSPITKRCKLLLVAQLIASRSIGIESGAGSYVVARAPAVVAEIEDRIGGFDFLVDQDGTRHAIWTIDTPAASTAGGRRGAWYARSDARGGTWSPAVHLTERAIAGAHIARVGNSRLVVSLAGAPQLFSSEDGGHVWTSAGPRIDLPPDFEMVSHDARVVLAAVRRPARTAYDPAERGSADQVRITATRIEGNEAQQSVVAELPPTIFESPPPVVVPDGGRLHLIAAINGERRSGNSRVAVAPNLVGYTSDNGGVTWRGWAANPSSILETVSTVNAIDAVATATGVRIFVAGTSLIAANGGPDSPWQQIRPPIGESAGAHDDQQGTSSCAALTLRDSTAVAWIDNRNRRSDRAWWNPLGGLPWTDDDPRWANNDAFFTTLGTVGDGTPTTAHRLTEDLSYAQLIRLRADRECFVAAWPGRNRVGKTLTAANRPPALFFTNVGCQLLN